MATHHSASLGNLVDNTSQTRQAAPTIKLRVVLEEGRDTHLYEPLLVSATDTGEAVMKKLRHRYYGGELLGLQRWLDVGKQYVGFYKVVVEMVKLSPMSSSSLEGLSFPCKVFIESRESMEIFTEAFHRPEILSSVMDFAERYLAYRLGVSPASTGDSEKALLIGRRFNKTAACVWFLLALLISVAAGIGVGVVYGDVNLGMSAGTGILALLTAVEGLMMWLHG